MASLPHFTVFDIETTGLDPRRGHRIVEIAAVRIEGGIIQRTSPFEAFVNPERKVPWEATQVNTITDAMVAHAPSIEKVLPEFLQYAQGSILVAHNADFDMGFLNAEKEFCWGYVELPEYLCTMRLSQSVFPREFRHNLDQVALRLGLPLPTGRHRALPDVFLAAEALVKMLAIGSITSLETLRAKAGKKMLVRN